MKRRRSFLPALSWLIVLLPLVGAFFYTPLAFGGVTQQTMGILDLLLAAGGSMWLVLLLFQRRQKGTEIDSNLWIGCTGRVQKRTRLRQ